MRLFIAINFDATEKACIQNAVDHLRKHAARGRFVRDEHLHLTLVFLGEVEPNRAVEVCDAMDALDVEPFVMCTGGMDCFKRRGGDLWFLSIAGSQSPHNPNEEVSAVRKSVCHLQNVERTGNRVTHHRAPQSAQPAKNKPLHRLQKSLHENLKRRGFRLESRPYRPHITIGRNVELNPDMRNNLPPYPDRCIEIDVQSIELMQSEFAGGRLVYTPLYSKEMVRRV